MQRLGKNVGKYLGDGIDIQRVLAQIEKAADAHGWKSETFLQTDHLRLLGLMRNVPLAKKRVYISTGIHGDEPAGPLALLQLFQENQWPKDVDFWICPCLNPTGFPSSSRENSKGLDLNRQYLNTEAHEIRAHIDWLGRQPNFDVCVCLHEDWEAAGFYLYELNPDHGRSFAQGIIERVAEVCPIDMSSTIEGRPASGGIISPSLDPRSRPQWPESFYLITHKTRLSYTIEAPSDFQLVTRVAATVAAVRGVVDALGVEN